MTPSVDKVDGHGLSNTTSPGKKMCTNHRKKAYKLPCSNNKMEHFSYKGWCINYVLYLVLVLVVN